MANPRKRTLSKNLSQMKFMKRHSLGSQEEDTDLAGGVLTEKWVVPNAPPSISAGPEERLRIESFAECEDLNTFGRFSFNGYNKEIERLMRVQNRNSPPMVEPEDDADIPAEEVARRFEITSKKLLGKWKRGSTSGSSLGRKLSSQDSVRTNYSRKSS